MSSIQVAALVSRPRQLSTDGCADGLVEFALDSPVPPAAFVRRPELVQRLIEHADAALILIVAPPGYGKSALLAEWAQADERRFVCLGPSANTGRGGPSLMPLPRVRHPERPDHRDVLVVDDAHLLDPELLRQMVSEVLTERSPGSSLVLASRAQLELPLALLRSHRIVAELGTRDLSMGSHQATELLERAGFELTPGGVRNLVERTEGWPAALYLAAMSAGVDSSASVGESGSTAVEFALSQYLLDEVLSALPSGLMRLARRTAIIDELSPAACDAILTRHGCARELSATARRVQLLHPVDPSLSRYRWHPLVRDALLTELRSVEPELEPELHNRASLWYLEHGDIDRATEHACQAGDRDRAAELLWPRLLQYVTSGRAGQVRQWLRWFREDQIAESTELAASAAHCALWGGGSRLGPALGSARRGGARARGAGLVCARHPSRSGGDRRHGHHHERAGDADRHGSRV
jgi:LuxR family maltose regulon positive regulatory protein